MKPHVLLIEPMMPEVEAQLDAAYCVHRLFAAHDRAALIATIGSSGRVWRRMFIDARNFLAQRSRTQPKGMVPWA